ncbi:MAG TPA: class I SAM-dependent methyltransferase [Mycobacteriales bacterium]|nr:class I SAM-dependent methyltransferase [Mycobacteriales bacterium]
MSRGNLERQQQLAYSDFQEKMLDEPKRRTKAAKIASVLGHFLGRDDLTGLVVADVGCSVGFISDEMHRRGGQTFGVDIDVPGLAKAQQRFGTEICFLCADGEALPWRDETVDVVVFNHIYEHVVDPDAVMAEIRRVLRPDGVVYLGLGNRLGVMEPHYRLPFLSWLPHGPLADRYVRAFGRADSYYERFRGRAGLRRLVEGLHVWDYTFPVLADPVTFHATDMVRGPLTKVPPAVLRAARPIVPTYIWVGSKSPRRPAGPPPAVAPTLVTG